MAVLGAVCRSGDAAANECLCVYVCVLCTCVSVCAHTHRPCQCRRHALILMEAECYFILPLVTAVSGRHEEWRAERERERETLLSYLIASLAPAQGSFRFHQFWSGFWFLALHVLNVKSQLFLPDVTKLNPSIVLIFVVLWLYNLNSMCVSFMKNSCDQWAWLIEKHCK